MTGVQEMSLIVMHTAINFVILMAMIILAYTRGKDKDEGWEPSIRVTSSHKGNDRENKVK